MKNDLKINEPRLGWFEDGLPNDVTPSTATMLVDNGNQIILHIPWYDSDLGLAGQIERWFSSGAHYSDDPGKSTYSYEPPAEFLFHDAQGSVLLIGCKSIGYESNPMLGVGKGRISADAAIIGAKTFGYSNINGMRTEISGLGDWFGLSSIEKTLQLKDSGGYESVELKGFSAENLFLHRRLNLRLIPTWESGKDGLNGQYLKDRIFVETRTKSTSDWEEHLDVHSGLRDLLRIATWNPAGYESIEVLKDSDARVIRPAGDRSDKWCALRSHVVVGYDGHPLESSRSLFYFNNLGRNGFGRWMNTRKQYKRGINPIMATLESTDWPLETQFMNVMIGLEAIGYARSIELKIPKKAADDERMGRRLERIISDCSTMPFPEGWHEECASVYNGIKHANKKLPEFEKILTNYYRAVLLFRIWIATRLGVPKTVTKNRLARDSMLRYFGSDKAVLPETEW